MKQAIGDAGVYTSGGLPIDGQVSPYCTNTSPCNNTGSRNFSSAVTSKTGGHPLVYLNQYNAVEACKSM